MIYPQRSQRLVLHLQLAKGLLDVKEIANSAEAKMAIAELTSKLAEAQVQIADLKVEHLAKDEAIRELEKKLAQRAQLVRHNDLYFVKDNEGNPTGDPICPKCFEGADKRIHLVYYKDNERRCPECNTYWPLNPRSRRQEQAIVYDYDPLA